MRLYVVSLFVVTLFAVSFGDNLPGDLKKCKKDSPDFSKCMGDAFLDALKKLDPGIKELDAPTFQPLHVPSITIGEGTGAVNVVQKYKNYKIYDVSNSKIKKIDVKVAPDSLSMDMEIFSPDVRFESEYSLNGRLLLLPISGDGNCVVRLQNLKTDFSLSTETYEKRGKKYYKVKNLNMTYTPEKVLFQFDNLFNGDPRLGPEMNKVLNENWYEVFKDIKHNYEEALATVYSDYANKVFSKIPCDEMFD